MTDLSALKTELKQLLVTELNLEHRDPASLTDDGALFGDGLGLDSLDALQLATSVEERYGVAIPEGPEARQAFASISTLAEYIAAHRS